MDLQVHPLVAGIYPKMSSGDFGALCRSIKENGLREPITLYEGMILDGDHRYQACEVEGVELRTIDYVGDEPLKLVEDLNSHRRHLGFADRKASAKLLLERDPSRTDRSIARQTGVSKNSAGRIRREMEAERSNVPEGHNESPDLTDNPANESQQPSPDLAGSSSSAEDTGTAENPETGVRVPQASDTPKPRKEASGRKARGRKPGTGRTAKGAARNAALAAEAAKPGKLREQMLLESARLCKADCRQHGHDLVSMFVDCARQFQENVPEPMRRDWHQKITEALGFRLTEGPVI